MDNFWKWLKQANARAVFLCLLAALTGVTAWWAWKLITPIRVTTPPAIGISREQAIPALGILAYLNFQQAVGTNRAANLFTPAEALNQAPPSQRNPDHANQPPQQEPRKDHDKPVPVKPREVVTLTYRGMIMRGDGVPLALITDSKSRRTAFYTAGTNVFGLKLTTIEAEKLSVGLSGQSSATLQRGVPQAFPESRHAD